MKTCLILQYTMMVAAFLCFSLFFVVQRQINKKMETFQNKCKKVRFMTGSCGGVSVARFFAKGSYCKEDEENGKNPPPPAPACPPK